MPKKENNFFALIYETVKRIPEGKVATYGQIASLVDTKDARKVGWALHANSSGDVPCHRVVNKNGELAENFAFDGWREQKARLMREGVGFLTEKKVDLNKYLWGK